MSFAWGVPWPPWAIPASPAPRSSGPRPGMRRTVAARPDDAVNYYQLASALQGTGPHQ